MKHIHEMARSVRFGLFLIVAALLSLTLAACSSASAGAGQSTGDSNQPSASVVSEKAWQSPKSDAGTQGKGNKDAFEIAVPDNDPSYAENHLIAKSYSPPKNLKVSKNGKYTDKDHVALYIHQYGQVPSNYISKTKARNAGWVSEKGNLWDVLPGRSIGGGGFYNDDNMMPDAPDREWFECDIDYEGGYRNAKRLVYSDDGLIYYTDDHYKTFQRLY